MKTKSAFTLLELLVAMVIIGLLVTLAVPASQRLVGNARSSHCMGNLRSLGTGLSSYLAEHNNNLPTMVIARESKNTDEPAIDNTLIHYVDGPDVFCCKSDHKGLCEKTGTSYLWNNLINGQNVASMNFMGFIHDSSRILVMGDKESFHPNRDVKVNILYLDGHVSKDLQFVVNGN